MDPSEKRDLADSLLSQLERAKGAERSKLSEDFMSSFGSYFMTLLLDQKLAITIIRNSETNEKFVLISLLIRNRVAEERVFYNPQYL